MVNYSLELSSPMTMMMADDNGNRLSSRKPRLLQSNDGEEKLDNNHQQQHEHLRLFDHFRLDPNTGELCLKKQLDYESIRVFDLPVMATDRGKKFFSSYFFFAKKTNFIVT